MFCPCAHKNINTEGGSSGKMKWVLEYSAMIQR